MPRIQVCLADDHGIVRAGLKHLINSQPDMEVVAEASTIREVLHAVPAVRPSVLCLDLTFRDGNSLGSIGQILRESPATRVLVVTACDERAYVTAALAAGASGYVVKAAEESELLSAIRAVHDRRTFVDCHVLAPRPGAAGPAGLSAREREVLKLLAEGHTNQQAADLLFLSVKTVETYRARLGEKLGLKSRADIVRYALENGIVRGGGPSAN